MSKENGHPMSYSLNLDLPNNIISSRIELKSRYPRSMHFTITENSGWIIYNVMVNILS